MTRANPISRFCYQPRRTALRLWMFNVHLYAGLALGILTTLVGLSGSIVVYKPEIERAEAGSMTRIVPAGTERKLDALYATVHAAVPRKRIDRLYTWGGPRAAWAFRVIDAHGNREYIYVDPYRGEVLGRYPMDGTWLQWTYNLHENLLMGKSGLVANGFGALLLVAMCLTGAIIWWPGAGRLRYGFKYHPKASWRGQVYDLHKIAGIAVMVALGLIAITGAYYSFPDAYRRISAMLTRTKSYDPPPPGRTPPAAPMAPLDSILRAARQTLPQADLTILTWPADSKGTFTARKKLRTDWSRLGNQYLYLDPHTAAVVREDLTARMPIGGRIIQAMAPLHYGSFWGHWSRVLWILMGLFPGVLAITGFLMWWNRVVVKKMAAVRAAQSHAGPDRSPALGSV
jgi:uncharacterized iron-regulated membrane protein